LEDVEAHPQAIALYVKTIGLRFGGCGTLGFLPLLLINLPFVSLRFISLTLRRFFIGSTFGRTAFTSSASGFLMCSLITRAIGRAPISSSSAET
jgi:hypothetical protein